MTGTLLCRATSHEDHTLRPILAVKGWSRDLGGAVHDPAELAEEAAEEGKQIQVTEVVNLAAAVANEMPSAEMAKQMALMAASGC